MHYTKKHHQGFTIVELLIVIVVIAILATITIVSYTGVQDRANDVRRQSDVNTITKTLEMYRISNGVYPTDIIAPVSPLPYSGWEFSLQDNFLSALRDIAGVSTPVDPVNNTIRYYRYHLYNAGEFGCDASKGKFYVLQVINENNKDPNAWLKKQSPGFACSGRDWSLLGTGGIQIMYTVGAFVGY